MEKDTTIGPGYISEGKRVRDFTEEAIPGETHAEWVRRNNKELLELLRKGDIDEVTYLDRLTMKDLYMEKMAMTDSLTGLENRRAFQSLLDSRQIRYAGLPGYSASVAFVDLDNLKAANAFGSWAGDAYLVNFAQALNEAAIELSRILSTENQRIEISVARLGGDEFGIYVDSQDPAILQQITEFITKKSMEKGRSHSELSKFDFEPTASYGWRSMSADSTTEDVIKEANIAQIGAKVRGKNTTVHYEDLSADEIHRIIEEQRAKTQPIKDSAA